ncbi:hypothetical protein D9M71_374340 [compost metagenome]
MLDAGDRQVALLVHRLHPAQAGAGHGGAVVAVDAADDDLLLGLALERPVVAHQAQHGVVAFGAGTGKEHVGHAGGCDVGNHLGQLQHRRVRGHEESIVERQFFHLLAGRLDQLIAAVAHCHAPQARHTVEDLVAFTVPQVHALGLGDDPRAFFLQLLVIAEGGQVMLGTQGLPLEGLRVLDAHVLLRFQGPRYVHGPLLIRPRTAGTRVPRN